MTKLRHMLDCENGGWKLALGVGAKTGLRSLCLVSGLVGRLESPSRPVSGLQGFGAGALEQANFPEPLISPKCAFNMRGEGHLLSFNGLTDLSFASVNKEITSALSPCFSSSWPVAQIPGGWNMDRFHWMYFPHGRVTKE